ncbi:hypothetical protein [Lysobacter capsici]|uniref:hypothetical protein n=1 Tax=Lysobacter capsici TaxID=435897 RepID=UPI001C005654|nr:hypothetical protein [Lysobacter capsici]QWF16936.1 hypothetical protein KME82_24935 [Lysobacter capsici]
MKYTACFFAAALAAVTLAAPAAEPQSPWGPSNNPMNGAGVAHNAYLGCMLARDPTGQRSPLEVLVYDCGMPVEGARDAYVAQNKDFFNQSHFNADKSLSENLDPYRSRYSAAQFSYIQGIDQIFATAASLSEVESKLAALEDHAVASLARGPADLQILGGVSVTRASLQQWKSRKNPANEMIFATSFG